MKKLIDDPADVTTESIEGYANAYPQLVKQLGPHVVCRVGKRT